MMSLTLIVELILFAFGFIAAVRTSPLNRLKFKPFSCNVCLGFWSSLMFSLGFFAYRDVFSLTPSIDMFIDYVSNVDTAISYIISSVTHALIGTGAVYAFFKVYPDVPRGAPPIE